MHYVLSRQQHAYTRYLPHLLAPTQAPRKGSGLHILHVQAPPTAPVLNAVARLVLTRRLCSLRA